MLDDIATWLGILLPVILVCIPVAFVYAKKADIATMNIESLKEQIRDQQRQIEDLRTYIYTSRRLARRDAAESKEDAKV